MSNIFITVSTFLLTLFHCNIKVLLRIIQPTTLQFVETCCKKQLGLQLYVVLNRKHVSNCDVSSLRERDTGNLNPM